MAAKREEMTLWTGYFDSRLSRSDGRRVPKEASIPKPTLESVVWAARSTGIRKMRQESEASHPSRPHAKEGRLVMPPRHVFEVTGASSKEGVMLSLIHISEPTRLLSISYAVFCLKKKTN